MLDLPIRESVLPNGIRIASQPVPGVNGAVLGMRVDCGSRDEAIGQRGISHLLEHMVFKGTARRTARQIAEVMDTIGGQIDAYTTKEYTGYALRVLPSHLPPALDLLTDMLRNSLFAEADLELEKSVILEEFRSIEDAPEEFVHEFFCRAFWPDHPLGAAVIGVPEEFTAVTRADLDAFRASHYLPNRILFAASGAIDHESLVDLIGSNFGDLRGEVPPRILEEPVAHLTETILPRPLEQAHLCLGVPSVHENDPSRWAVRILTLILGGSMSSRLFQEIREKRGLCYSIGAEHQSYREGGYLMVYADTSPVNAATVRELILEELASLAEHGVTGEELDRAREQVRTNTLLSLDDAVTRMGRLAHSMLYQGEVVALARLMAYVDAVTLEECHQAAAKLFGGGRHAYTMIGPAVRTRRPRGSRKAPKSD